MRGFLNFPMFLPTVILYPYDLRQRLYSLLLA